MQMNQILYCCLSKLTKKSLHLKILFFDKRNKHLIVRIEINVDKIWYMNVLIIKIVIIF